MCQLATGHVEEVFLHQEGGLSDLSSCFKILFLMNQGKTRGIYAKMKQAKVTQVGVQYEPNQEQNAIKDMHQNICPEG